MPPAAWLERFPLSAYLLAHISARLAYVLALIVMAKKNAGKITMASSGVGTPDHVYGELFNSMVGITMLHVPYRGGGPKMTDLLAGQVHLSFEPATTGLEHIRAGRVRALAVTSMQALPRMETHVLDAGHKLLETHAAAAAPLMLDFVRHTQRRAKARPG